jgi:hypothetical protein
MPAIFCTTEAAIVVRPWVVSSASRLGEPAAPVGVAVVVVAAAVVPVVPVVLLMLRSSSFLGVSFLGVSGPVGDPAYV